MSSDPQTVDDSSSEVPKDSTELTERLILHSNLVRDFQRNPALPVPTPYEVLPQPAATPSRKGPFLDRVEHLGKQTLPLLPGHLALFFSISLVFSGICFTSSIGQLGEPLSPFTELEVRRHLGIASLLFIVVTTIAVYAVLMITPFSGRQKTVSTAATTQHHEDPEMSAGINLVVSGEFRTQRLLAVLTVLATEILLLAAFIFVFLAVMAYAQGVGVAGVSVFGISMVKTVVCWTYKFVGTDPEEEQAPTKQP